MNTQRLAMLSGGSHATSSSSAIGSHYKTILLHVEDSQESDARLKVSVDFAHRCSSNLIGLGGSAPIQIDGAVGIDWQIVADQMDADTKSAETRFVLLADVLGSSARWLQGSGDPTAMMADSAGGADLIIAGAHRGPRDSTVDAGSLAISAGIPLLAIPAECTALGYNRITIAWKNTREARRAVTDALPFLREAGSVLVVAIEAENGAPVEGLSTLLKRLRDHGVDVESCTVRKGLDDAVGGLLARAEDDLSELIVCGAYGHTRLREWCFGGFTAGLLERSNIPVLFSH